MAPRRLLRDGVSAAGLCHGENCVIAVEFVRNAAWLLNCQGFSPTRWVTQAAAPPQTVAPSTIDCAIASASAWYSVVEVG